jgi:hypothetical protein
MKGTKLRIGLVILSAAALAVGGCGRHAEKSAGEGLAAPKGELLSVDFEPNQTLEYSFTSRRDVTTDWGTMRGGGQSKVDKNWEKFEMTVSFTPVEIDPYGVTKVRAKCSKATALRSAGLRPREGGTDPAEYIKGKSWTFSIDPRGKITDNSELAAVLTECGNKAMRKSAKQGTVKRADMIYDIIALQWFMWDAISSIPNPAEGVTVGEKWQSLLSIPGPMILWYGRDTTYELAEIQDSNDGKVAVIKSTYEPVQLSALPEGWPVPYGEPFQMSGTFGFLRNYKVTSLTGTGEELFDIDEGRIISNEQKYTVEILTQLPIPMGVNPRLTMEQTLSTRLVKPKPAAGQTTTN